MAELQIESVQQQTNEINDRIDSFYDALENEVNAKHYVDENHESVAGIAYGYDETGNRKRQKKPHLFNKVTDLNEKEAQIPQAIT